MRKKIIEMIVGLERRAAERAVRRKGRKEGWSVSKIMAEEVAEADLAERISLQLQRTPRALRGSSSRRCPLPVRPACCRRLS